MASRRRRNFHLQEDPSAAIANAPPWYTRGVVRLPGSDGEDLCDSFVEQFRRDGQFRSAVLAEARSSWWAIRMGGGMAVGRVLEALIRLHTLRVLLVNAGVPEFDVDRFYDCLSHGCTCDGCDLANGQRFERIMRERKEKPPRVLQGTGGVAEGSDNQNMGVPNVESAGRF